MEATLTATGASLDQGDTKNSLGSALKDAGGPCINVLTKLVTMVSIVNVAHSNWVRVCQWPSFLLSHWMMLLSRTNALAASLIVIFDFVMFVTLCK
jgi:hypothetical protein